MNKINIKQITCAAITALLLASCASDDMMDGTVQDLPEGKYPLQISSVTVTGDVQTRVSENSTDGNSSVWDWDGSEQIGVQLYENGETASYTLKSDQTLTATDNQLYWNSTASTTVYAAWYPFVDGTIDLSKQNTDGLAYVMKGTGSGDYKNGVSLSFTHQLAKIRVALSEESNADLFNDAAKVEVLTYPSCTVSKGTIDIDNLPTVDYIPMCKVTYGDKSYYEANVVPNGTVNKFRITLKDKAAKEMTLDSPVTLEAAKLHLITLTVSQAIDLTAYADEVYTVPSNTTVILDGKGQVLYKRLVINSGARVTLKNVKLYSPEACYDDIIGVSGSATLIIKGENEVKGSNYSAIAVKDKGTLTIEGTNEDKLTVTSAEWNGAGCLCAYPESNIVINGGNITAKASSASESAGIGTFWFTAEKATNTSINITINGGIVYAEGGKDSPGIGSCNQDSHNSGNILITGGNVTAISGTGSTWGGAGIGSGSSAKCGKITITGGNVTATSTWCSNTLGGAAGIGSGNEGECGDIAITGWYTSVTATTNNPENCDDIGRGYNASCGYVDIDWLDHVTATNGKIYEKP